MKKIQIRKILVPTDFSESAQEALVWAKVLAGLFGAEVSLLHVVDTAIAAVAGLPSEVYSVSVYGELLDRIREEAQVALNAIPQSAEITRRLLKEGHPREVIVHTAKEMGVDLIVMGTHGRRGVSHFFFGSVAEYCVRMAPVPVLTVRAP